MVCSWLHRRSQEVPAEQAGAPLLQTASAVQGSPKRNISVFPIQAGWPVRQFGIHREQRYVGVRVCLVLGKTKLQEAGGSPPEMGWDPANLR